MGRNGVDWLGQIPILGLNCDIASTSSRGTIRLSHVLVSGPCAADGTSLSEVATDWSAKCDT
jgi:hypothetical protein